MCTHTLTDKQRPSEAHSFRPSHQPCLSTVLVSAPQLPVHICSTVLIALSWNLLTRSHHSCELTMLPQKGQYVVSTSSASKQGLAHGQLSKLFFKSMELNLWGRAWLRKPVWAKNSYRTHSALPSTHCQPRHLWHLTKPPEKKYINMEGTKPTTRTLPDGSMSIHNTSKISKQNG